MRPYTSVRAALPQANRAIHYRQAIGLSACRRGQNDRLFGHNHAKCQIHIYQTLAGQGF
jgi:hypothetical protein